MLHYDQLALTKNPHTTPNLLQSSFATTFHPSDEEDEEDLAFCINAYQEDLGVEELAEGINSILLSISEREGMLNDRSARVNNNYRHWSSWIEYHIIIIGECIKSSMAVTTRVPHYNYELRLPNYSSSDYTSIS